MPCLQAQQRAPSTPPRAQQRAPSTPPRVHRSRACSEAGDESGALLLTPISSTTSKQQQQQQMQHKQEQEQQQQQQQFQQQHNDHHCRQGMPCGDGGTEAAVRVLERQVDALEQQVRWGIGMMEQHTRCAGAAGALGNWNDAARVLEWFRLDLVHWSSRCAGAADASVYGGAFGFKFWHVDALEQQVRWGIGLAGVLVRINTNGCGKQCRRLVMVAWMDIWMGFLKALLEPKPWSQSPFLTVRNQELWALPFLTVRNQELWALPLAQYPAASFLQRLTT
eukprot:1157586-Pelagomonas_calceolata.AAC.12